MKTRLVLAGAMVVILVLIAYGIGCADERSPVPPGSIPKVRDTSLFFSCILLVSVTFVAMLIIYRHYIYVARPSYSNEVGPCLVV